ncbi:MAG: Na+/H+ antiporter NhaC family protein [Acidobacteriota bacterium]
MSAACGDSHLPVLQFYGGTAGALAPFFVFLSGVAWLGLSGAPDERGFWPVLLAALILGLMLCKDRTAYSETVITGMSEPIVMIMVMAWLLAGVLGALMNASGFIEALVWLAGRAGLTGGGFVAATFLVCCVVSTSTGTSLGTVLICSPLLYPAGGLVGAEPAVLIGAILGGATFGDNVSPVSDTTIASATTQGADIGGVVRSRLKYALPAAALALIGYLLLGTSSPTRPSATVRAGTSGVEMASANGLTTTSSTSLPSAPAASQAAPPTGRLTAADRPAGAAGRQPKASAEEPAASEEQQPAATAAADLRGSPRGLPMLLAPALVVGLLLARRHLLEGLLFGIAGALGLGLGLGLISPGQILHIDAASYSAGGLIVEGMERGVGVSVLTFLLMGLVAGLEATGTLDRMVGFARRHVRSARDAELWIFGTVTAAVLLITHSAVAILTVGNFSRETGEAFGIHPYRRANILDITVCTYPFLLPIFIPTILTASTTAAGVAFGLPRVSPLATGLYNLHSWALLAVLVAAILTGFGRPAAARK